MSTSDKILLAQTIAISLSTPAALLTVWAMFRQTQIAASLAQESRRRQCLEQLLSLASPRKWPQSGAAFYQALNSVPVLFSFDREVLDQFRVLRQLEVHRDPVRGGARWST
jgi:hypothetical protein